MTITDNEAVLRPFHKAGKRYADYVCSGHCLCMLRPVCLHSPCCETVRRRQLKHRQRMLKKMPGNSHVVFFFRKRPSGQIHKSKQELASVAHVGRALGSNNRPASSGPRTCMHVCCQRLHHSSVRLHRSLLRSSVWLPLGGIEYDGIERTR